MRKATRNDILIVGAGPTGLVLAIELARRGVGFRLIDKRSGPTMMPRAFTLHARTMEIFEDMGVVHHFLSGGIKSKGFNFHFKGKGARPALDFSSLESTYPYVLIYDQSWTDKHLREHLESTYDIKPEWSTEIVDLKQDADKCKAVLLSGDSETEEVVEPTWVVGCDGVRSFVRKAAGLDDCGTKYDGMVMEMMDTKLDGFREEDDRVHYFISKENFMLVTKLPDGNHRIGVSGMSVSEGNNSRLTQRERFQNLVDEHLEGVTLAKPELERKWEVWRRIAKSYRCGNIFLAGDAAHVHSPSGGQGMNVSMQDAFNLGWKLAMVVSKQAHNKLLDTYVAEREPVGEQVLEGTDAMHDIIMAHGQGMEDRLKLTQADGWHESTVSRISGLSYNYCSSSSLPSELKLGKGIAPGCRAINVKMADGTFLFDLLRHPRMSLLIGVNSEREKLWATEAIRKISLQFGDFVNIHTITGGQEFTSRYGAYSQPHIYLARPDGYIACHCFLEHASVLIDYMTDWFLPRSHLSVGFKGESRKAGKICWPKISQWIWQNIAGQTFKR